MSTSVNFDQIQELGGSELLLKLRDLAPRWLALGLVVVIAWQVSSIVWALIPGGTDLTVPEPPAASAPANATQPAGRVDTAAIANAHLFGVADATDEPQVVVSEVQGPTTLNIVLKGTIAADDPQFALAIIADQSKHEKVYAIRDTVASGATLHKVENDRVILNRGGRLEELRLPREFSGGSRSSAPTRRTNARTAAAPPAGDQSSVREVLTQNVATLTDVIRPQPYFVGGQQKGYRIYPGKDRKQFAALGLRPGDLVTEINGTPMTDPRQGMEVFRSLGDATSVTVTVERNGQPETLTLTTDQLNSTN